MMKRTYVACAPCRKRKVRCEIVDNPPCAKCHREHRECTFQTTSGAKRREAPRWARTDESTQRDFSINHSIPPVSPSSTQGPTRQDGTSSEDRATHTTRQEMSWSDDHVMSAVMTQPNHALEALYAAARSDGPVDQLAPTPRTNVENEAIGSFFVTSPLSMPGDNVLDAWDRFRFIRQGWFTAQEAVTYVDLFFQNLAPLCPLALNKWKDHGNHERLITQEAMLCATILAISSRFHVLTGPGGYSRSHAIHAKLWDYCQRLIQRLMLGQEKASSARIRTVGTIEALILISDWQPRAVHFPPDTDGWDVSFLPEQWSKRDRVTQDGGTPLVRWQDDVFEPAKRSDRMSWMLLGAATNLMYELGLRPENHADGGRFERAKTVLSIFVTQLATRLGMSSFLPTQLSADLQSKRPTSTSSTPVERQFDHTMNIWVELISLEKTASTVFFRSTNHVQQTISEGRHIEVTRHFMPSMQRWKDDMDANPTVPLTLKQLMMIQFYHLRILIFAISLQAAVGSISIHGQGVDLPQIDAVSTQDQSQIRQLIDDCHAVLKLAADLAATNVLRYAPLRTLVNVTSASVFLLKAISLGTREAELRQSLYILEQSIRTLKAIPVDDMHFAARYASLIEKHVDRFKANFKIVQPTRQNSPSIGTGSLAPNKQMTSVDRTVVGDNFTSGYEFGFADTGPDLDSHVDEWWSQPFDPAFAPFSMSHDHVAWGLDVDSLNFLWNMPAD